MRFCTYKTFGRCRSSCWTLSAKGELKNGTPVIKLYQSKDLMAEIPAVETNDDFNEPEVNFIKMIDAGNDNQVKFIFGSMDFNAYAVMDIAPEGYIRPQR